MRLFAFATLLALCSAAIGQDQPQTKPTEPAPRTASPQTGNQEKKVNLDTQPVVQAKAFLATLTEEQKAKAVMGFDSEGTAPNANAITWSRLTGYCQEGCIDPDIGL